MKSNFNSIISGNTPVLVDFHANWCGPCKMLAPILEQVKEELGGAVKIIKVDIDKNELLAARYQVKGVPTLLLFKNGIQVWRQSGVIQKNEIIGVINQFS